MKYQIFFLIIYAITTVAAISDDEISSSNQLRPSAPTGLSSLEQIVSNAHREKNTRGQMDPMISFTAHVNVDFKVPSTLSSRSPLSISDDIQEIRRDVLAGRRQFNTYNKSLQQLFFERLMVIDERYDPASIQAVDRMLTETYAILYNRLFTNPHILEERQMSIHDVVQNIIRARMPLVNVLHGDKTQTDPESMVFLRRCLQTAARLSVDINPFHPDERLLSDMLRGLRAIQKKVLQSQQGE